MQLVSNGTRVSLMRSGLDERFWCHALVCFRRNFNVSSTNPLSGLTP